MKLSIGVLRDALQESQDAKEIAENAVQQLRMNIEWDKDSGRHLDPRDQRRLEDAQRQLEEAEGEIADYRGAIDFLLRNA
jgi:cell fate (sporulation/competence/biofilm development) regulator YlbF (YheA/YmcA/DUF963 family)